MHAKKHFRVKQFCVSIPPKPLLAFLEILRLAFIGSLRMTRKNATVVIPLIYPHNGIKKAPRLCFRIIAGLGYFSLFHGRSDGEIGHCFQLSFWDFYVFIRGDRTVFHA